MQAKQQPYPPHNNPATAATNNRGGGGGGSGGPQAPLTSHSQHQMLTANTTATNQRAVSAQIMESLLTEISMYAAKSSLLAATTNLGNNSTTASANSGSNNSNSAATGASAAAAAALHKVDEEESLTVAAEMAAAKLERMGAAVGYRITERLAEQKTWNATHNSTAVTAAAANNNASVTNSATDQAAALVAAQQLEAVKFLCKDVWIEIFNKQIDKLQTNHRGVFVLKDLNLTWLTRFPVGSETSRVSALRLLAFPCGVVRGALANLGIPAVVSCEFLADGHHMAACSFNIKVK
jgi:trafficking protein particle complex subunit 6